MNILFIDTETTGLIPGQHSIIEIAAEHHKDGVIVSKFNQKFINRNPILDMGALRVNRHRTKSLLDIGKACPEEQAVYNFMDFLLDIDNKDLHVCGHNVHFDVAHVKALLSKYNIEGWDSSVSYRQIDTCDRAKMLIQTGIINLDSLGGRGSSLQNVATALGIQVDTKRLHTASYDVELCAKVFYKMNETLKSLKG